MRTYLLIALVAFAAGPLSAQLSFSDRTDLLGNQNVRSGVPMGIVDMNDDGLDDIIRLDQTNHLYIEYQTAAGAFTTYDHGVLFGNQWSLCIADADDNGFNDIFTGGGYNSLKVLRASADGSSYSQTLIPLPEVFLQGSNFADIDNDGDSDVFACHDDGLSVPFNNNGSGVFTADYSLINAVSTVPSDNSGNYGSVWTDYDNDGDLDLYISKCRLGVTNPNDGRRRNLLFRNNGDGTFTDVAEAAGLLPLGQSWATDFGDLDNDGDLDAFVINHDILSKIYRNDGNGQFSEITPTTGIPVDLLAAGPGIQVLFEDFDNDSFLDILYTTNGNNHCLFRNNGNLTFTNFPLAFPTQGWRIHTATTGDLDDDGYLDVYAGFANGYNTPGSFTDKVFINDGAGNNYLKVRLEGVTSNANGIGARLEIYGAWGVQVREVRSGESYGIMRSFTRHFGLGQATTIDSLIVRWPSGVVDQINGPDINQTLVLIEGNNCPGQAAFEAMVTGSTASFTDLSTNGATQWLWNFGDGTTSTEQNPQHTYPSGGSYTVCLEATGLCGPQVVCQEIALGCATPAISFSSLGNGLTVSFFDASQNSPISWLWNFGDGSTSPIQNPTHGYAQPGNYTVCLAVTNTCGTTELCETITVSCAPPGVGFTATTSGLFASFSDNSAPSVSQWLWDFGDGASSTLENPQHTYDSPGTYEVCLTATDACATSEVCQTISVSCAAPAAGFGFQTNQLSVSFTDASVNSPTEWRWDFGDGTISELPSPQHTYAAPGTYQVCLTVQSACGQNQLCQQVTVNCAPPVVGFSFLAQGLSVSFTDGSGDEATSWSWDFGDGNTSSQQNPQHTYAMAGMYQVCLEIGSACGANQVCLTVNTTCATPQAVFSTQADQLTIFFNDESTSGPSQWFWSFGDGATSTEPNPQHTYAEAGNYQVCLAVSSMCGADQTCETITVNCAAPQPAFSTATSLLIVSFSDNSENNPETWLWDFGDGESSTEQNPIHTYDEPGTYEVCLTTTNSCGSEQVCQTITLSCSPPVPSFGFQTNDLSVSFTDASVNNPNGWLWDFGDGNTATSQNPQHTYAAPGDYEVCLQVTSLCGSNQVCNTVSVICAPPSATFSQQQQGLMVSFTDLSGNAVSSWSWTFGDGAASTEQNPAHSYAGPGDYEVCLTVNSVCGLNQSCETITVSCAAPTAGFSSQADELTVSFTDASQGGTDQWLWTFGDGGSSTEANPQHTYPLPGEYEVCLEITGACGTGQVCELITVSCASPQAGFSSQVNGLTVTFTDNTTGALSTEQWSWTFGDGSTSGEATPQHTYAEPGEYQVCLAVTSPCGTDQVCELITVSCAAPAAAFGSQASGLSISFTDNSTNQPTQWSWTFGDGDGSTEQNPQHTYNQPGAYEVCLTASSSCGSNQTCTTVTVNCTAPQASFTYEADELVLTFIDQATNDPVQWYWSFGDGQNSTETNPVHTYAEPGTYTVCQVVSGVCGTTQQCQLVEVTCSAPQAGFDFVVSNLDVAFTDLSAGSPAAWLWDFGDGQTSTAPAPSHTYDTPGDYEVCLTVENLCGLTEHCMTITAGCSPAEATFSLAADQLIVSFTDQTQGPVNHWLWTFGDGASSTLPDPQHAYDEAGEYEVCLQITGPCGSSQSCETITVTCTVPEALFSVVANGFSQIFVDASTNEPTSWLWTFGDGTSSTQQNPQHNYPSPGVYEVCLVAGNGCGTDTRCQSVFVEVTSTNGPAGSEALFEVFPNPVTDQLTVQTEGLQVRSLHALNAHGQVIARWTWPAGANQQRLDTGNWPAGVYWLVVYAEEGVRSIRVVRR